MVAYLQGSNVGTADMNIYWHFLASEGISVHDVTRSVLWSLWNQKASPPPKLRREAKRAQTLIDDSFSQAPVSDKYLYLDPVYPEIYPP